MSCWRLARKISEKKQQQNNKTRRKTNKKNNNQSIAFHRDDWASWFFLFWLLASHCGTHLKGAKKGPSEASHGGEPCTHGCHRRRCRLDSAGNAGKMSGALQGVFGGEKKKEIVSPVRLELTTSRYLLQICLPDCWNSCMSCRAEGEKRGHWTTISRRETHTGALPLPIGSKN